MGTRAKSSAGILLVLATVAVILYGCAAPRPSRQPTEELQGMLEQFASRIDPYSRRRVVRAVVRCLTQDPLGSTLRLEVDLVRLRRDMPGWVLYRIEPEPYRRRAGADEPIEIDIAYLADGGHTLELVGVSAGDVYQWPPTKVSFTVRGDREQVVAELGRLLKGSQEQVQRAMEFLRRHPVPYLPALKEKYAGDPKLLRRLQTSPPPPSVERKLPPLVALLKADTSVSLEPYRYDHRLRRQVKDAYDFTQDPLANPRLRIRIVEPLGNEWDVKGFLLADGAVWFTCAAGVGRFDLQGHSVRMYSMDRGVLPGPSRLLRGWDGGIYLSTRVGRLLRFDEAADLFRQLEAPRRRRFRSGGHGRLMATDALGVMWGWGSSLMWVDGEGIHYVKQPGQRVETMVRVPDGSVWAHGGAVSASGDKQLWPFYPVKVLQQGYRAYVLQRFRPEPVFVDYLGNGMIGRPWRPLPEDGQPWHVLRRGCFEGCRILVPDPVQREIWGLCEDRLVCLTRLWDPNLSQEPPRVLPPLWVMYHTINEICFVSDGCALLGERQGLWRFDGRSWRRVIPFTSGRKRSIGSDSQMMARLAAEVRCVSETKIFKSVSAAHIRIKETAPQNQRPPGKEYRIQEEFALSERGEVERYYTLVETAADGKRTSRRIPGRPGRNMRLAAGYDGSIWLFGRTAIYRVKDGEFHLVMRPGAGGLSVAPYVVPMPDGTAWICSHDGVKQYRQGKVFDDCSVRGGRLQTVLAVTYDDPHDTLYLLGRDTRAKPTLLIVRPDSTRSVEIPEALASSGLIDARMDTQGRIWLCTRQGLYCKDGWWMRVMDGSFRAIRPDEQGRLLVVGYDKGWILAVDRVSR